MAFLVMLIILFLCYIFENDRLSETSRTVSLGIIVVVMVLYLVLSFLG